MQQRHQAEPLAASDECRREWGSAAATREPSEVPEVMVKKERRRRRAGHHARYE
jgi:hypothetical protein